VAGFLGIMSGEALDHARAPSFAAGSTRRLAFLGIGGVFALLLAALPTRALRRLTPLLYAVSCLLLAACFIPGLGAEMGGARRWVTIPFAGIRIQPSEFTKLVVVLTLAAFLSRRRFQSRSFVCGILLPTCLILPPAGLIALEVDLAYTALLLTCALLLMYLAGVALVHVSSLAAACVAGLAAVVWSIPNRRIRIDAFLNPDTSAAEAGYQQWRSMEAFARASPIGSNPADGHFPPDRLPLAGSDFIFPALGETWGVAVCLIVLLAYLVVLRAGFSIARHAADDFSRLAASGLLIVICLQALLNVGIGLALLPVSGLPLPLVSAGGSNLVVTAMIFGVLWRIRGEALRHCTAPSLSSSTPRPTPVIEPPAHRLEPLRKATRFEPSPRAADRDRSSR
jgi:cell division protein FtsW